MNLKNKRYLKDRFSAYDFSIEDIKNRNIDEEYIEEVANKTCVYIQYTSDLKKFYVGESNRYLTNTNNSRFMEHINEPATVSGNITHNQFDRVVIIISRYLRGNADILETKLLKFIDTEYLLIKDKELVNSRINQAHAEELSYEIESELFPEIWSFLKERKFVKSELEDVIKNPIKYYSPFGKILDDLQVAAIQKMVEAGLSNDNNRKLLIQGEPGTGKTFITATAIFELIRLEKKVAIIVNQTSMIKIYKDLFKLVSKSSKPFIGSLATFTNALERGDFSLEEYSLLIVDEAHRLKQPQGRHNYLPSTYTLDRNNMDFTELDIIENYKKSLILMYDEFQLIRDSDIDIEKFKERVNETTGYEKIELETQYRIKSSSNIPASNYTKGIRNILQLEGSDFDNGIFNNGYKFKIVDSLEELVDEIKAKTNASYMNARILSGFYKEWISKDDLTKYEWDAANYGVNLRWNTPNSKLSTKNWLKYTTEKNLEFTEVGCIHIAQGMDLDYAAVIIGNDLDIETIDGELKLVADIENYHDTNGIPIQGTDDGSRLTQYIKKVYYVLLTRGIYGTFVYIENPEVKKYFKELIENKSLV